MNMDQLAEPVLPHPADAPARPATLHIDISADPTTGYAAIQNNLPVLRALTLTNPGEAPLEDIEVLVSCAPAFARGERLHFERLAPGEVRRIAPLDLKPEHAYLAALDESERGEVSVSVSVRGVAAAQAESRWPRPCTRWKCWPMTSGPERVPCRSCWPPFACPIRRSSTA